MTYVTAKVPIEVRECDQGIFVASCDKLNISVMGETSGLAMLRIKRLVDKYFEE